MDSDFRPRQRSAKSLRASLEARTNQDPSQQQTFQTPEQVASQDNVATKPDDSLAAVSRVDLPPIQKTKASWRQKGGDLHWPPGRREYAVMVILLLLLGGGIGGWWQSRRDQAAPVVQKVEKAAAPKPKTVASTLTGLQVDPAVNLKPVTGVMIENSMDARPQSGLGEAGVVFEAIAEGGITRFLALFQDTAPGKIGPVRSARPYYLQWNLGFDAGYAHVGGSPEALQSIKAWGVRDLDQFANAGAYHRISERAAPHNVYTSITALNELETSKGYTNSAYTGFARKNIVTLRKQAARNKAVTSKKPSQKDEASLPGAKTIEIGLSGPLYNVHYDYAADTNSYNRSEGGAPHIDANTTRPINPAVVIAMVMPYSLNGKYSVYQVIGSGPVFIFQDGVVATGTWTKSSDKSQITFTDAAGKAIELNPGLTWLTAVSDAAKVSYAP